jgi:hypothetical protein
MSDETPDLETRMEQAVLEVLRDAFPAVDEIASWSDPRTDAGRYLSVRVETAGEEIPNTGIESLTVTITGKNLTEGERRMLKDLYGSAGAAREALLINAAGKFVLPAGEAVEVGPGTRVAEGNIDRLTSYNFTVSAQPFELILAA